MPDEPLHGQLFNYFSIIFQPQSHHNIGLFIVAQPKNMPVKLDEPIFLIKIDGPRVFLPNAQPNIIGICLSGNLNGLIVKDLSHLFPVKFIKYVNAFNFKRFVVFQFSLRRPEVQF